MRYRPVGRSGLLGSVVGLGCNNFGMRIDLDRGREVIDAAEECGITLLDTAELYGGGGGSESALGELLEGRRDRFVIATKFGHAGALLHGPAVGSGGSRSYIRRAVEGSLRRLRTDWIDLYQMHTPDPDTPVEETVAAMQELVVEGKVRYLGHSNLAAWQAVQFAHTASGGPGFVSAQNHYSLLERRVERDLVPACQAYGVGVLPYFPLANGLLTGKVSRTDGPPPGSRLEGRREWITEDGLDRVEALKEWAQQRGHSVLEAAIAGLGAQPTVASVIAGATSGAQVRANAAAAEWELTTEELADIDRICPAKRPTS